MAKKRVLRKYDSKKREWFQLVRIAVIVAIIAFIVFNVVVGISRVDGQSMEPTLDNKQTVFFWRLGNDYEAGDIVAIKMPNGDRYVKRIIGLPGDEINIENGYVYVNGNKLRETYIKDGEGSTETQDERIEYPYKVDNGEYFVLGDNRQNSMDSRTFGPVIKENIKGVLLFSE